ncbi:uncharacterized protein LOC103038882 [Astyanax mexicanus]|uniref:uncharacterized protein LOC103038882 n=1 Tax=Astyanax mexicanus TaxID=7994 RepID=UPI0020CB3B74|nr:uncharacterized protein LOC103038882 [Astyanax mexicanus]
MDESLWCEKTCSSLISALPLWIIEYAWTNQMEDVLEVLGPPLWLEGDCRHLTPEEPCSLRVMAAETWMVIRARDIKHFERVMEFLEVTYGLMPQLVSSIKHMKIMFGLKTLVIMWMLWDDQSVTSINDKITRFFPENLPHYHGSSRKHLELMQKTQQDFKRFAQSLARNPDMRKAYIRDLMEEQYGERYAMKVEERLLHYLKELNKALPQPTHIDQILKQSFSLDETEKLLHQLLTCNSASLPTALKRLLRCAMATHFSQVDADKLKKRAEADRPVPGSFCIALRSQQSPEERLSQQCSQGSWLNRNKSPSLLQKATESVCLERPSVHLKPKSGLRLDITQGDLDPCVAKQQDPQRDDSGANVEKKTSIEEDKTEHLCSKHGKNMKSILLECSEELKGQNSEAPLAHLCTPSSPLTPLLQSTPQRKTHSSASPPHQDSSSTYVSLSSHRDSSSSFSYSFTNLSGAVQVQDASSQCSLGKPVTSSLMLPVQQQDIARTSSDQQQNISTTSSLSAKQISPFLFSSLKNITTSSESSGTPSLSLVPQECSSPLANLSAFPMNQHTLDLPSISHDISCLPKSSSQVQQESSLSMLYKNQTSSPASTSTTTSPASSSSAQQESSSSMLSMNQISSPASTSTTTLSSAQKESSLSVVSKSQISSSASTSTTTSPASLPLSSAQKESSSMISKSQNSSSASTSTTTSPASSSSAQESSSKLSRIQISSSASTNTTTSPTSSSSVQQESSLSMLSKNQISSPGSTSPATSAPSPPSAQIESSSSMPLKNQISSPASTSPATSSSVQQESSLSMLSKNQISSPATSNQSHNSVSFPSSSRQDVASTISGSDSVLRDKLKLSLETQAIFLQCKWLQPQVLLCRLSQQNSAATITPKRTQSRLCEVEEEEEEEEEEENVSFDVNLLYSDSESDPQDSDDPDYAPSKRRKSCVDF